MKMNSIGLCKKFFFFVLLPNILAAQGRSLQELELNRIKNVRYDFNIPSARSIGMGGAFIAIANDATAGEANAAGLTQLWWPRVSLHYKYKRFRHEELAGTALDPDLTAEFRDDVVSQSFLSVILPDTARHFFFSFYRQELINFARSFSYEHFVPKDSTRGKGAPGIISQTEILVVDWAAAVAYRLSNGFSIGLTLRSSNLRFRFIEEVYEDIADTTSPQGNIPRNLALLTQTDDTDRSFGVNISAMYKITGPPLNFGVIYKTGAKFDVFTSLLAPSREGMRQNLLRNAMSIRRIAPFRIPTSFGFGIALGPINNWVFSFDAIRIHYTDLLKDQGEFIKDAKLTIDNGYQFHFGVERFLRLFDRLVVARAGMFREPNSKIYTLSSDPDLQRLFPRHSAQYHFTGGFGLNFSKISLDFALHASKEIFEVLFSSGISI
ncbi:MAG: OmpP1/FadL family transporter [Candidatus Hodarchaeota archaeon]